VHEAEKVDPKRGEPIAKLDDVKPTLPTFHFAHSCLSTCQQARQVGLAQPMSTAMLSEEMQEDLVLLGV
jgi:hypothetical protein